MDLDAIRAVDVARVLTGLPDHDVLGAEEIDGSVGRWVPWLRRVLNCSEIAASLQDY
jgi:hypothetical protein